MELSQYMHERLLHGHILNSNNQNVTQLIELDNTGNILNTYYYIANKMAFSSLTKLAIICKPTKISYYKYTIQVKYGLYMFLFINNIAAYNYIYKLYDLSNMTFM